LFYLDNQPRPIPALTAYATKMGRSVVLARLAEAASLLQQAETIMDRLWQDESDRGQLAPDILDLLQQTAIEIEQAAGTLAQVTYQPDADETAFE